VRADLIAIKFVDSVAASFLMLLVSPQPLILIDHFVLILKVIAKQPEMTFTLSSTLAVIPIGNASCSMLLLFNFTLDGFDGRAVSQATC